MKLNVGHGFAKLNESHPGPSLSWRTQSDTAREFISSCVVRLFVAHGDKSSCAFSGLRSSEKDSLFCVSSNGTKLKPPN